METKREQITTEVVFNGDRTYEIKRRIEGYKGDKAILIGLTLLLMVITLPKYKSR